MTERTRIALIGGFLGAGKTTLINRLAERLVSDRKRIGVITNDQGKYLIDTEFVKVRDIDVEEVTGSCFCCNFPKFFENVEKMSDGGSAEYILAEPVGSCTDLVATIMLPLSSYHGKEYSIAPLIVLVDGTKMIDRSLDEATLGGYLRHHQVAEAEYLVLTKTDMLSSDAVVKFLDELGHINPFAKIIRYSAVTGEGLDEIMEIIDSQEETDRKPVDVDYERYAKAEAELGWYNGIYEFKSEGLNAYDMSQALLEDLGSKYPSSAIAHAKVALSGDGGHIKVSLVGKDLSTGGVLGAGNLKGKICLNFNARISSEPDALRSAIRETVDTVMEERCIRGYRMTFDDCFAPGKPNPTYRMV